jgi:hypothetical protein
VSRAGRVLLAAVLVAAVVRRVRIAAGMRRGDQTVIDAKRHRNKRFANKMVTRVGRAGPTALARPHYPGRQPEHCPRQPRRSAFSVALAIPAVA